MKCPYQDIMCYHIDDVSHDCEAQSRTDCWHENQFDRGKNREDRNEDEKEKRFIYHYINDGKTGGKKMKCHNCTRAIFCPRECQVPNKNNEIIIGKAGDFTKELLLSFDTILKSIRKNPNSSNIKSLLKR